MWGSHAGHRYKNLLKMLVKGIWLAGMGEKPLQSQTSWTICVCEGKIKIYLIQWIGIFCSFVTYSYVLFSVYNKLKNSKLEDFFSYLIYFHYYGFYLASFQIYLLLMAFISYSNWFLSAFIQFKATYFIVSVPVKVWSEKQNHQICV